MPSLTPQRTTFFDCTRSRTVPAHPGHAVSSNPMTASQREARRFGMGIIPFK